MPLKSIVVTFEIPNDPQLQAAFGLVTMRHAHLDYVLRLTIKSVTGRKLEDALTATFRKSSSNLHKEVLKEAKKRIRDGKALNRLNALLKRCESATKKRNELVHEPIVRKQGGRKLRRFDGGGTKQLPSLGELKQLERDLSQLVDELCYARKPDGFLAEALAGKK